MLEINLDRERESQPPPREGMSRTLTRRDLLMLALGAAGGITTYKVADLLTPENLEDRMDPAHLYSHNIEDVFEDEAGNPISGAPHPKVDYDHPVTHDAIDLRNYGYSLSPEELVMIARLVEREICEPTVKRTAENARAITRVMKNRLNHDREVTPGRRRYSHNNEPTLFHIAFRYRQFSAAESAPAYFRRSEIVRSENNGCHYGMYVENGDGSLSIQPVVGMIEPEKWEVVYDEVLKVLKGEIEDNTGGALHYQNPMETRGRNNIRYWINSGMKPTHRIGHHVFLQAPPRMNAHLTGDENFEEPWAPFEYVNWSSDNADVFPVPDGMEPGRARELFISLDVDSYYRDVKVTDSAGNSLSAGETAYIKAYPPRAVCIPRCTFTPD